MAPPANVAVPNLVGGSWNPTKLHPPGFSKQLFRISPGIVAEFFSWWPTSWKPKKLCCSLTKFGQNTKWCSTFRHPRGRILWESDEISLSSSDFTWYKTWTSHPSSHQENHLRLYENPWSRSGWIKDGTVDGLFEIRRENPPGMVLKPVVNNGINYQPQLVLAGFLNHPSTVPISELDW